MRRFAAGRFALALAAGIAQPPFAARADNDEGVVRIMTQNVYEGTNFSELLAATTPPAFLAAVTTTRQNILATKPAVRAAAIAREIARERPHLVALQEAAILRTAFVPLTNPPTAVTTVEVDQLALVLAELDKLGHRYHAVSILPNLDAQAPSSNGASIRITTRTGIIARSGRDDVRLSNIQSYEYLAIASLPTPVGLAIPNQRGWTSVDVTVNGREVRFVTTHLDQSPAIGAFQVSELLQTAVKSTTMPVVLVGDFNVGANVPADPSYANYQALLNGGLIDAWTKKNPSDPGLTCCQTPSVSVPTSNFVFRVDLMLLRGNIDIRDIHLVGNTPADFANGVWPSDHAGIVATFRIPNDHYPH
jgi:endonuclease/exonuclease/phosphatase family metal-dependent hydrolase